MNIRFSFQLLTISLLLNFSVVCHADTIIKLNLSKVGPDVAMNGVGQFATSSDGDATTLGDQDTAIEFTGFLDPANPDITSPIASFTLTGLSASGSVQQFGSLAIQNFAGGQLSLYDPSNNLLLSGNLTSSVLSGVIGPPGTAAIFTTALFSPSGGSLANLISAGSMSLSINMTNVNGGSGLAVSDNTLQQFQADASVLISGDPAVKAPEPSTLALLVTSVFGILMHRRNASRCFFKTFG